MAEQPPKEAADLPLTPEIVANLKRLALSRNETAPLAQFRLGEIYELGEDPIGLDRKQALRFYRMCAERGAIGCQLGLGRTLVADSLHRVEAMAWLELAAEGGSEDAKRLFADELLFTTAEQLKKARVLKISLVIQPR